VVEVLNKVDLLDDAPGAIEMADRAAVHGAIGVSALTGQGLEALRLALDARISGGLVTLEAAVAPADGARLAWLYAHGEVVARQDAEDSIRLTVRLSAADRARFDQLHEVG